MGSFFIHILKSIMKGTILTAILLALFSPSALTQTKDLLPENSFTSGIEGPATDKYGNIYIVNFQKEGTIGKITPTGKATIFTTLPAPSVGNSIRIQKNGNLIVADYKGHNLIAIDTLTGKQNIYAHSARMNQPNDLAISHKTGIIYASDPNWKESAGKLWAIYPDGMCKLLEDNMGTTNGIELSPDNKYLYINESVQRNLWRYTIDRKGNLSGKILLHKFDGYGLDGMKCDKKGNLFITRYDKGTIEVIAPSGIQIKEYKLKGMKPSNLTFSPNGEKLYVTMQDRGTVEIITIK